MDSVSPTSEIAVETRGLSKTFGSKVAVRDLSLAVGRGEIFGFLGPNGAGKSTSIKMLLGLVRPSGGEGFVLGAPISDVAVRRRIGFLPEDFRFYDWLTARELVTLHGRLCGMTTARLAVRAPDVIDLVGLSPHLDRRVRGFSKGMLQRLGLAQALVHEPDLVFLDEPTSGLDPMGRRLVRDILRDQRARGATIFLNSHLLSEIEVTCDRVVFIKDGAVVAGHDLRADQRGELRVVVRTGNLSGHAVEGLARWTTSVRVEPEALIMTVSSPAAIPDAVRHLVASDVDIFEVVPERVPLEELFVRIMGEDPGL
ncbi:MAG TPA: ABC transporter ATP-binding protein [Gemmatimonadaceae bacterium]|nr:ABC transporter ATP-binding protein [Gemmatimonadaceae bacterium]